ncbi:radial spoke head 10 homolog B-like [Vanessa atalanta]|uniref:radial spoke head 10 homolog B-like n=1 Tax=Vanessa atalanta TaxID=42275 RepID=UPI001FCDD81A|nr:radial spoke head 10 homolog B-like [Vanessa atalanta]
MFYIDSQKTLTRRDSSLILTGSHTRNDHNEFELLNTHVPSTGRLTSDSGVSLAQRPKGSVRKEIITALFESMLDNIVESWEIIGQRKNEEFVSELPKTPSELIVVNKKKKTVVGLSKTKKSRSKIELDESTQSDLLQLCWWSAPDERAYIRFRNGNVFEGNISMKCMHGEGRYQWSDGTIFLGQFKDNKIMGKGVIQWKNDTWYEGDFVGNLRHGKGLYVDSRNQCSYSGGWHYGTKHGEGVIHYSGFFKNSYDGQWVHNVRHGFGSREYCEMSGYKGEWDTSIREGKGLMIWPNHDFYRGEWKNGIMSGYGVYIWDAYYNNSMSSPSLCAYRGSWEKGTRNGYGVLNLGLGLGSFYKGEFKNNKKHGVGRFVTNNGLILQHKQLFFDDNIGHLNSKVQENEFTGHLYTQLEEPYTFDICDNSVGLIYHIEQGIKNIDKQHEIRAAIINDFIEFNKATHSLSIAPKEEVRGEISKFDFDDFIEFEVDSLRKALKCYESDLKKIYYRYATICNREEIHFTPVLIRLYLWQLFYDCNIHTKGLTLFEIDKAFHENPDWISKRPQDPFETIYFWQFQHYLITVSRKLYAKKHLPTKKPDSMIGNAFRIFMEKDVLPGAGRRRGKLVEGYGSFVPLKGLYELYCSLGEPCTIRKFLCAIRQSPHCSTQPQQFIVEDSCPIMGLNAYIFGNEMTFITDDPIENNAQKLNSCFRLFNISNLSSKTVIKIFSFIFPQICVSNKIIDLNVEITFFEFFEAFIICVEESIRVSNENQENISLSNNPEALLKHKI